MLMGVDIVFLTSRQGVRAYMQQSRVFVGMVLILIFGEVLGLYGYVPVGNKAAPVRHTDRRQFDSGIDIEHENRMRCLTSAVYFTVTEYCRHRINVSRPISSLLHLSFF